ncbi:MAG: biotin--[acetyl-CoA-carboxylase] ligase [Planctomycetota bacterium]
MHLAETESTNTAAAAEAERRWSPERADPIVVSADRQTAGRGRDGRSWASPIGGAYLSVAYPWPRSAIERSGMAPFAAGLALRSALGEATGVAGGRLAIKWPNDALLDGRKVAGVLCERRVMGDAASSDRPATDRDAVVVGVGVNVLGPVEALGEVRVPATTLALAIDRELDPADIADAVATQLVARLDCLLDVGWTEGDHAALNDALAYRGEPVAFTRAGQRHTGTLLGVAADGHALIHLAAQATPARFAAGDIDRLSPADRHDPLDQPSLTDATP